MPDTIKMTVAELKPHPLQSEYYRDVAPAELDHLVESISQQGLRHPPEILPNGTILDGHQRLRAIKRLGWDEVECVVREELADDEPGQESFLIEANLTRRRDDPLSLARCCQRLQALHRKDRTRQQKGAGNLRDLIASKAGLRSGRQVDRLLQLLRLPRVLQDAITNGRMSQAQGHKLLKLQAPQLDELVQELKDGADVQKAVKDSLVKPSTEMEDRIWEYGQMLSFVEASGPELARIAEKLAGRVRSCREAAAILEDGIAVLSALRDAEVEKAPIQERKLKEKEAQLIDRLAELSA